MLYSCKELFERVKAQVAQEIDGFPIEDPPKVCIITTGDDEPSQRYVRNKLRDFENLGIAGEVVKLDNSMQLMYFLANNARKYDGVIVQRPIDVFGGTPKEMAQRVAANMPPEVDIDGVGAGSDFMPPSVRGLDLLLREWDYNPAGKTAVVIGRGDVGRPVAEYLLHRDSTVTICHSKSGDLERLQVLSDADLIVGAAGLKDPIYPWAKQKAVIIDFGITKGEDGKLHGDFQSGLAQYYKYHTAVPGGMGLMVRAGLLLNIVDAYERRRGLM